MLKKTLLLLASFGVCASAQNYTYDKDGVLQKIELENKSQIAYTFDKCGNLLTQRNIKGEKEENGENSD
jgi:YD repeat-containing protein